MNDSRAIPTLQDVADLAEVSTATVSRCLNLPDQVSMKTRKKVDSAIDALGYTPNFGARVMAAQRTKTIGAIIPTMENAVFARGIQAFQEELDANGYTLLVASSSYQQDLEERQIRSLVARGADALLLIGYERDPEIFKYLHSRNIPALVTWAFDASQSRPSIGFDNRGSMRSLAREVLRLGHRRLAMISVDRGSNDRVAAREDGVYEAIREMGLPEKDLTLVVTNYSIETGASAFADVMQMARRPTVVFCANDVLAVGALREARKMGMIVPDDVSIVGFDDIELTQVTHPELTTVHVPHSEMGRLAAKALIDLLENGTPLRRHELVADIRLRGSLSPPAIR
ncbi:LacI family DNA-binding transcriptional regulator [Jannaschia sp. CCS1]|uniref:LacI family DNA-binding transcriptional regulator n=1 Tax=Jannaschia sp. (strain CCS1) TaxID=290400 RepID=UPI000053BAB9|nr:LacI family DNA-binding transcriptional regulator [Jannaschia sp. CCS1]ABD54264.1 transcriptional regulator, LacI family [Jannaschia sp. CCS1]